jgi:hypothetical protein
LFFPLLYVLGLAGSLLALALRADRSDVREQNAFRVALGGLALLLAAVGVGGLMDVQGDGVHSLASASTAYLVFGALALGALTYFVGIISWRGRRGFVFRFGGWVSMALALMVPSALTLALPLVSVFVSALRVFGPDTPREMNGS